MREKKLNIDGERGRKMRGQRKRERERMFDCTQDRGVRVLISQAKKGVRELVLISGCLVLTYSILHFQLL